MFGVVFSRRGSENSFGLLRRNNAGTRGGIRVFGTGDWIVRGSGTKVSRFGDDRLDLGVGFFSFLIQRLVRIKRRRGHDVHSTVYVKGMVNS